MTYKQDKKLKYQDCELDRSLTRQYKLARGGVNLSNNVEYVE